MYLKEGRKVDVKEGRKEENKENRLTSFTVRSFIALALTAEAPFGQDAGPIIHTWVRPA